MQPIYLQRNREAGKRISSRRCRSLSLMMDTVRQGNPDRQFSQLPDQLPFRNEDADLFSFLDGLGTNQSAQNDGGAGASARSTKASYLTGLPSWLTPLQEQPGSASGGNGLQPIVSEPGKAPGAPLGSLPLPDIPLGGLPLGEDNLFMSSLGPSLAPAYSFQQMPQDLEPSPAALTSPCAGASGQATPSMPLWPIPQQAPMATLLSNDDYGDFVPVSSGLSPAALTAPCIPLQCALHAESAAGPWGDIV